MAYLRGYHHIHLRGVEEIVETVLELPVSLGQVSILETQVSEVLTFAPAKALEVVQQAPVKKADCVWPRAVGKREVAPRSPTARG